MNAKNNLNYKFVYSLEKIKKSYKQYALESSEAENLLPVKVRVEPIQIPKRFPGAKIALRILNKNTWRFSNTTGLRPIYYKDFYYGDFLINNEKSLILVKIDLDKVTLRLFPQFYTNDKQVIEQITDSIVQKLLKL